MGSIIVSGITLGLAIAILVGPVFFLIINTAIKKGFLQAFYVALGVALCDVIFILVIYFGFYQFQNSYFNTKTLSFFGGVLLVIFGLMMVIKKVKLEQIQELAFTKKDRLKYFVKGFLLNAINPSVILFWIAAVSATSIQLQYNGWHILVFFVACVATMLASDVLKIYLSVKLTSKITAQTLHFINVVSGIAMILYGIYLLFF